jgi:flagellar basal body rod protein FlgG
MDPLAIAASGMRSSEVRIAASAHNVANLLTPSFRPLRVHQSVLEGGGSTASVRRADMPEDVDLLREFVEQMQAKLQFQSSARFFSAASETSGHLIDLLA